MKARKVVLFITNMTISKDEFILSASYLTLQF